MALLALAVLIGCKNRVDDIVQCTCIDSNPDQLGDALSPTRFCVGESEPHDCLSLCGEGAFSSQFPDPIVQTDACERGWKWKLREILDGQVFKTPKRLGEYEGIALNVRSMTAPYAGPLVTSGVDVSRVRAKKGAGAFTAWIPVTGSVSMTGELCPSGSCPLALEFLEATTAQAFTVAGDSVSALTVQNAGPWTGVKKSDDSFYFHQSSTALVSATVNGTRVSAFSSATNSNSSANSVFGSMAWPGGTLPRMNVNGTFSDGTYTIEVDLSFNFTSAAPAAKATPDPSSSCPGATYSGLASSTSFPLGQLQQRWLDQNGAILGTGACLTLNSNQCMTGDGPVVFEVRDPAGRVSYAQPDESPVLGTPRAWEMMGAALASADFNGDGYWDVFVGVPADQIDGYSGNEQGLCGDMGCDPDQSAATCEPRLVPGGAGAGVVLYGGPNGLSARDGQFISQYGAATWDTQEIGDSFGQSAAVGDFNGDGFPDLAVGVPGENHPGGAGDGTSEGAVNVFYGSTSGLTPDSRHTDAVRHNGFAQGLAGLSNQPEANDRFGSALAAGDFDGDHVADLAIGAYGEDSGAGAVTILYGASRQGLSPGRSQYITQATIPGLAAEANDQFGAALDTGDVNNDGYADLVIGAPGEDGGNGAVTVLRGGPSGLRQDGSRWNLTVSDVRKGGFGTSVLLEDLNGDTFDELVVGSPSADINGQVDTGLATRFNGSSAGIVATHTTIYPGKVVDGRTICGTLQANGKFGSVLQTARFDGDEVYDVLVGTPLLTVSGQAYAGSVLVLASSAGPSCIQDTDRSLSSVSFQDMFGFAIASGDFDRNGRDDIAMGVPGELVRAKGAGAVRVLMAPDARGAGRRFDSFTQDTWSPPPPPREYRPAVVK